MPDSREYRIRFTLEIPEEAPSGNELADLLEHIATVVRHDSGWTGEIDDTHTGRVATWNVQREYDEEEDDPCVAVREARAGRGVAEQRMLAATTCCARERAPRANSQRIPPAPYGDKPMTEQQAAAAQARLDAVVKYARYDHLPRWNGEPIFEECVGDHGERYLSTSSLESVLRGPAFDFLQEAPNDLRLALSAIRRVREGAARAVVDALLDSAIIGASDDEDALELAQRAINAALDGEAKA